MTLRLGKFKPDNKDCTVLSHKYHVKEDYFYCKDKGSSGKWKIEIKNLGESPTVSIDFRPNNLLKNFFLNEYMAQDFTIPFFEMSLSKEGYLLLHGGAVEKNGKALVLLGRPGSYKTTLLMDLVRRHNFNIIADDRILIKENKIYPFPQSPFYFNYLLNNIKNEKLSRIGYFKLFMKMIYGIDSGTLPNYKSIVYNYIYFLSRKKTSNLIMKTSKREYIYKKIFINNFNEYVSSNSRDVISSFYKYILMYSLLFPNNIFINYWKNFISILNKHFFNISFYEIDFPFEYDLGNLYNLVDHYKLIHNNMEIL
jgi:hypothetical protein